MNPQSNLDWLNQLHKLQSIHRCLRLTWQPSSVSVLTFAVSKGNEMGTLGTGVSQCSRDGESLVYMDQHGDGNLTHSATGYTSIDHNIAHILLPFLHMPCYSSRGGVTSMH